jgi:hypothetical protein
MIAHQKARAGILKMLFQEFVQSASLNEVSVEVVGLTLHRTEPGILEDDPIADFVLLSGAMRVGDLLILVVLFGEILEDAAGLEEGYLLSVAEGICDGWNASIVFDLEEPGLLLGVFANIDMLDFCMAGQQHQRAWLSIEEW